MKLFAALRESVVGTEDTICDVRYSVVIGGRIQPISATPSNLTR
jgi:hypothetical protein